MVEYFLCQYYPFVFELITLQIRIEDIVVNQYIGMCPITSLLMEFNAKRNVCLELWTLGYGHCPVHVVQVHDAHPIIYVYNGLLLLCASILVY